MVGQLQRELAWRTVAAHAPLPLLLLAVQALWWGRLPGLVAVVVTTGLIVAVQLAVQTVALVGMIVPAQRRTEEWVAALAAQDAVARWAPGLLPYLQHMGTHLRDRNRVVAAGRAALFSRPGVRPLSVTTPDGVVLDGALIMSTFGAIGAPVPTKAIVYLGGNGAHYEANPELERLAGVDTVVITANYRGVGASGGMILDAASLIAYAVHGLGLAPGRVVVFGHSIGGGVAVQAAAAVPGVGVISDRSFGTLSRVALYHVAGHTMTGPDAGSAASRWQRYALTMAVRHVACVEMDSVTAWSLIAPTRKLLVAALDDAVIPLGAQLITQAAELPHAHATAGCTLLMHDRAAGADAHNCALSTPELRRLNAGLAALFAGTPLPDRL